MDRSSISGAEAVLITWAVEPTQAALTALLLQTVESIQLAMAGLLMLTVQTMQSAMSAIHLQTTQAMQALLAALSSGDVEWATFSVASMRLGIGIVLPLHDSTDRGRIQEEPGVALVGSISSEHDQHKQ